MQWSSAHHFELGTAALRSGDAVQGFLAFRRALSIQPNEAPLLVNAGEAAARLGGLEHAVLLHQRALAAKADAATYFCWIDRLEIHRSEIICAMSRQSLCERSGTPAGVRHLRSFHFRWRRSAQPPATVFEPSGLTGRGVGARKI